MPCNGLAMKAIFAKLTSRIAPWTEPLAPTSSRFWTLGVGSLMSLLVWQLLHRNNFSFKLASLTNLSSDQKLWLPWLLYHCGSVVFLIFIPLLLMRISGDRFKLADLGFSFGNVRSSKFFILILAPIFVVAAIVGSYDPLLQQEYPLLRDAGANWIRFGQWQLLYALYYLGWEGFFRGILLFGLRKELGTKGSIFFQTALSVLVHLGKPAGELIASMPAGFIFGAAAIRMKSFWPVFAVHWLLGLLTDLACYIQVHGWPK